MSYIAPKQLNDSLVVSPVYATTAPITLYVRTTGSDSNSGLASGSALLTIQEAINRIPKRIDHQVTIDVGAGTFAPITIEGFHIGRNHGTTVTTGFAINGTLGQPTLTTGTPTGTSTAGTDRTLTDSGQTWTVNELRGMFCRVGTDYRVIRANTATELTLAGNISGGYGSKAYEILECKTVIQGVADYSGILSRSCTCSSSSQNNTENSLIVSKIKIDARQSVVGAYTAAIAASHSSIFGLNLCQVLGGGTSTTTAAVQCYDWPNHGPSFTDCAILSPDRGDGLDIIRCQGMYQCDRVFVYNAPQIGMRMHSIPAMCNFGEIYIDTAGSTGLRCTACAWVDVDYADIKTCTAEGIRLDNGTDTAYNFAAFTHLNLTGGVIASNTGAGIALTNGSLADLKDVSGTANGTFGVSLKSGSRIGLSGTVTITGASGDLSVNNDVTALTWAGYLANNGDLAVALNTRSVAERVTGGGVSTAITTWLTKDGSVLPPLREVRNNTEPTLLIGEACLWLDQDDADKTYLVYRNSQNAQVKIALA